MQFIFHFKYIYLYLYFISSQVSKIYELILRDAIMEHLVKNQLLRDSQHGFLRGRSCLSNLFTFLDKVTDCVDKGIDVDVIFGSGKGVR